MKKHIEILNVGPIKGVRLDLNKVNIFMGEQSSGKSTIAKIISFCNWVEKDVLQQQSFENYKSNESYFIEKLETFHKLNSFFNEKSEIIFKSKSIKFHYKWDSFDVFWVDRFDYRRTKISYIPSERSVVILPEMEKIELPNNYLKSFLFDWFDARKNYSIDNELSILDIGVKYYYSENSKESHIQSTSNSYDILLSNASSGIQSITPLIVLIDHLTKNIYSDGQNLSYEIDEVKANVTRMLISELIINPLYGKGDEGKDDRKKRITEINKKISDKDEKTLEYFESFKTVRDNLFKTHSTNLIIEEPEQNLFPSTQKSLIYYLLESVNSVSEHSLTLTTHSPYVLYAINNCIMASLVQDKITESEREKLICLNSKIEPESISIYEIKNGEIKCIQDDDGLIGENFFDAQMKEVMDEFYILLNHF